VRKIQSAPAILDTAPINRDALKGMRGTLRSANLPHAKQGAKQDAKKNGDLFSSLHEAFTKAQGVQGTQDVPEESETTDDDEWA